MEVTITDAQANPNVKVVHLAGRLDTATGAAAGQKILAALSQCGAGLILDFAGMDFMSSAGISVLLQLRQHAQAANKQIAIIRSAPAIYKIFKITTLDTMFRFFEDETEALQALWPAV